MNIVVLCEGPGEDHLATHAHPGDWLDPRDFGAAHKLVERMLAAMGHDVLAFHPLAQEHTFTRQRGSALLHEKNLARIFYGSLTSAPDVNPIDLYVLFVDNDNKHAEREAWRQRVSQFESDGTVVIAVAVEEFEAWLLADSEAIRKTCGLSLTKPPAHPEALTRGEAKALLQAHCTSCNIDAHTRKETHRDIVTHADLARWRTTCPSFERFWSELEAAVTPGRAPIAAPKPT